MQTINQSRSNILNVRLDSKFWTLWILFYTVFMEALITYLHLPTTIRYLNDVVLIFLLFNQRFSAVSKLKSDGATPVIFFIAMMFVVDSLTAIVHLVPFQLYLWAVRNTFRGIAYFLCVIAVIKREDIDRVFSWLYWLQIPNLLLAMIQRSTAGGSVNIVADVVHGFFASGAGSNMFSAVILAYMVNMYLANRVRITKLIFTIICSLAVATLAEEKTFFIYFVIITIFSCVLSRKTLRLWRFVMMIIIIFVFMISWINSVEPSIIQMLLSPETAEEYLRSSWADSYTLPRVGSFPIIVKNYFQGDLLTSIIGIGFGAAEFSQFSFIQSAFALAHRGLTYRLFTHQWTFIETGYLGLFLYVSIFASAAIVLLKWRKDTDEMSCSFKNISLCVALCCLVSMWSNATLKVDACYIPYFGLALGFLSKSPSNT